MAKKKRAARKKRAAARPKVKNPGALRRKVGAKGTGWISAKRVKIVRRRGQPDQVLIERPKGRK